jgi:transcriptional regulator with XRE-family HTH domain
VTVKRKAEPLGSLIARRVRETREKRPLTQAELAQRIEDRFGARFDRATISKIESGGTRAANLSVEDLLLLAGALGVSPVHFIAPLENDSSVIVGTAAIHAPEMRAWIRGQEPLHDEDASFWRYQQPEDDPPRISLEGASMFFELVGKARAEGAAEARAEMAREREAEK